MKRAARAASVTRRRIPRRYLPASLSASDRDKQKRGLLSARRGYLRGKYVARPHVASFRSRPSGHVARAKEMYGVKTMRVTPELVRKTRCRRSALEKILKKGRGAYYSSGSRPNQTAESWALARLASALTGGKAAMVDKDILMEGCASDSPVFSV
jgi:Family of unknown function (DUF5824)